MTKYIAKLDGVIVGKRVTKDRTYTHCVVTQRDEAEARTAAYNHTPARHDFTYYTAVVEQGVKHSSVAPTMYRPEPDLAYLASCQAEIEGGWEGFVARRRAIAIERFEDASKRDIYQPRAHSWAGRLDLAQKEARRVSRFMKQVWVVEAEVA